MSRVVFAVLLALPLAALPRSGPDAVRLPVAALAVALLAGSVAWSAAKRGESSVRSDPLRTAILIFFAAALISLIPAVDRWASATSLMVLGLAVGAYLFVTSGQIPRTWILERGTLVMAGVGIVFTLIACVQLVGGRSPGSTLGNTNLSGAFGAMLFPVFLGMSLQPKRRHGFIAASVAAAGMVFLSQARGAMIATLVGGAVVVLALVRLRSLAIGAAVALVAASVFVPFAFARGETAKIRLGIWQGGAKLALDHPVAGCGIGNFAAQFPPHRSIEEFRLSQGGTERFAEVESAHSTWVEVAAETGALGLLSFLLVVYVAARLGRYYVIHAKDDETRGFVAGAGGGVAAFLVAGLFYSLLSQAAHAILAFVLLGMMELVGNDRVRMRKWGGTQLRLAGFGILLIVSLFVAVVTFGHAQADASFQAAMRTTNREERVRLLKEALDANYRNWRIHEQLAIAAENPTDQSLHWKQVLEHRPHNVEALNGLAVAQGNEVHLDRAIRIAPDYYKSYYNRGVFRRMAGDWAGARAMFSESIRCHPRHASSYRNRAEASYKLGDAAAADEDQRRAKELEP